MSRCDHYVEDIPMKLSRKFEPFIFDSEPLPDLKPYESTMREFTYEFNSELCALEVYDRRAKEICDEADKVRQQQLRQLELHQLQQQQKLNQDLNHHSSIPRQHSLPSLKTVYPNSLQLVPNHHPHSASPSPPAPGVVVVPAATAVVPVPQQTQPMPQSIVINHTDIPVIAATSSIVAATLSDQSNSSTTTTASGTTTTTTAASAPIQLKPINTKEFEDFVGSSPFDDALLRSLDDKQELNSVFANVYHNSNNNSNSNSNTTSNHYYGTNQSLYNNFNPR